MKVRLYSNEQSAAQATNRTLKVLPSMIGGYLVADDDGQIVFDSNGLADAVPTGNARMFAQAIVQQGYVSAVISDGTT